jgi:tetratricopeptide (TPR) repeat protein
MLGENSFIFRQVQRFSLRFRLLVVLLMLAIAGGVFVAAVNLRRRPTNVTATEKIPRCGTLRSMARIYMAYGEYAKAQRLAEEALIQARKQDASNTELATCLIDLGTLYSLQGRLSEAEEMCNLGLQLQKKTLFDEHPYIAQTLRTLSTIYRRQERFGKAKKALDDAIGIVQHRHKRQDEEMAPFHVDMAKLLFAEGKLAEAERYYNKAIAGIKATYGVDHLYTANVFAGMAELYELQGKYTEAEGLIKKALTIQEKMYGPEHHLLISSLLTGSRISKATGDYKQAQKYINKAINAAEKTGTALSTAELHEHAARI